MKNKLAAAARQSQNDTRDHGPPLGPGQPVFETQLLLKTASRTRQAMIASLPSLLICVSIAAAHAPTQRGCWAIRHRACGSLRSSLTLGERAQSPESSRRRNCGDSNVRNGPVAKTRTEAHIFRRNAGARTVGFLPATIRGSGIPRKAGSKRTERAERTDTSWKCHCSPN